MPNPFENNLLQGIRRQNLFGVDSGPFATQVPQEENNMFEPPPIRQRSRMEELYSPETQATEQFNDLLGQYPERNKPGFFRKLMAGMAGDDQAEVESIRHAPFYRELEDWKNKMVPSTTAMTNERLGNTNSRMAASQLLSQETRDAQLNRQVDRDDVLRRQGEERLSQADDRIKQANQRMEIARAVAKGGQLVTDNTGSYMVYRDGSKAPVDLSLLSQEELEDLRQDNALERIKAQGRETRDTQSERPGNRDRLRTEVIEDPDNPGKKILVTINLDTNEVKPATLNRQSVTPGVRTPESETQKRVGALNRARSVKLSNPQWSKWIKIKGNDLEIQRPNIMLPGGIPQAEYDKIYQAISGTTAPKLPNNPASRTGTIRIKAPDGVEGNWDLSRGPIPSGFTEIK